MGSKIVISNLVEPRRGDFISYKFQGDTQGEQLRVHRLAGMENDVIEIKDGVLHVNGMNADTGVDLVHFYLVSQEEYDRIKDSEKVAERNIYPMFLENSVLIILEDSFADLNGLSYNRIIEPQNEVDTSIQEVYNKDWNRDNFVPLKIPQGKVFVLGDSRHNSEDSRYIGLIDKSDIVGVVLNK